VAKRAAFRLAVAVRTVLAALLALQLHASDHTCAFVTAGTAGHVVVGEAVVTVGARAGGGATGGGAASGRSGGGSRHDTNRGLTAGGRPLRNLKSTLGVGDSLVHRGTSPFNPATHVLDDDLEHRENLNVA
jgi:hypothetical protein